MHFLDISSNCMPSILTSIMCEFSSHFIIRKCTVKSCQCTVLIQKTTDLSLLYSVCCTVINTLWQRFSFKRTIKMLQKMIHKNEKTTLIKKILFPKERKSTWHIISLTTHVKHLDNGSNIICFNGVITKKKMKLLLRTDYRFNHPSIISHTAKITLLLE